MPMPSASAFALSQRIRAGSIPVLGPMRAGFWATCSETAGMRGRAPRAGILQSGGVNYPQNRNRIMLRPARSRAPLLESKTLADKVHAIFTIGGKGGGHIP